MDIDTPQKRALQATSFSARDRAMENTDRNPYPQRAPILALANYACITIH